MDGQHGWGGIRVDVLGPLRLVVDGAPVELRGPKRRALLALLALAAGRTVPVEHLLDALWPAEVPESGRQVLHAQVSRLRVHLGAAADRLTTSPGGYRLDLDADELDLARARAQLRVARAQIEHDADAAYVQLRQVHGLWRGPVLADLLDVVPIAAAVEDCAQLHREVTDALVGAAVAAGKAEAVVGVAAAALAADPLREPAVLLAMRALAAAGRAAEALQVGRAYRRRLADETGLDPSSALDEVERAVAVGAGSPSATRRASPPRPVGPLFGREGQVAALSRLIATERLVTVLGPGGVGKTRVAQEVARRAGTAMVLPLAPVADPAAVPHVLATAMDLVVGRGDVLSACLAVLGERPALLVVDNCEHLLDAARDLVLAVLASCPRVTVLATSREPLGLAAEHTFRLAPLPLPGPGADLAAAPAVALFLDRAQRVRPGARDPAELGLVAEIVRRLDGVPLAIELAAGRLSSFSLTDLHARLDRALDLLGGPRSAADSRHRTLRAAVEWSFRLLDPDEQRLFRHLAVFVDGVDLDAAERLAADLRVAGDPGSVLARLVDTSMVDVAFEGGTRYRMLETLRAFGLDRLAEAGEEDAAARWLVRWAVELARWFDATVAGDRESQADSALRREMANLRAAWRTARTRGSVDDAAALVAALFDAIMSRDLVEIRAWAGELADDPDLRGRPAAAAVLGGAAYAAYAAGDQVRADALARAGLAEGGSGVPHCRHALAVAALARGAYAEVVEHCLAPDAVIAPRHGFFGLAALATAYAGDLERARALNDRWTAEASSPSRRAWAAYYGGEIDNLAGDHERAEQHYVRAVTLGRSSGDTFVVGVATVGLLSVRAGHGREHEALAGYRDVVDYFARTGNWTHQWTTLRNLADLLRRLGDHEPAALLQAAADAAPDAPVQVGGPTGAPDGPVPGRAAVLDLARRTIERHLTRSPGAGPPRS